MHLNRRFRPLLGIVCLTSIWLGSAAPAVAQTAPACQFILGFKTLHDLVPDTVGSCVEDQGFAPNGDAQQHTAKGLLAWRKVDNWTAFTDGYTTWINGPDGLVSRLNTDRFPWEAGEPNPQPPAPPAAPTPVATPVATPAPASTTVPSSAVVTILDTGFVPQAVTVVNGGSVTWINKGTKVHSVTAVGGPLQFDSGGIGPGGQVSFSFKFPNAVYGYDSSPDCLLNSNTGFFCSTYVVATTKG